MDKKLLMKVGIGAGVLVLGFLAYKKFVAKPAETKSAEATPEEEVAEQAEAPAETPTAVAPKTKNVLKRDVAVKAEVVALPAGSSDDSMPDALFKRFGITESAYAKVFKKEKEIAKKYANVRLSSNAPKIKELREFLAQNNISIGAYNAAKQFKVKQRSQNVQVTKTPIASFMDFDANNDALGSLM